MKPFNIDPGGQNAQADKEVLRGTFMERRRVIPLDLVNTTQWKVINHLRTLISSIQPAVIALYYPIKSEIDLRPFAEELWDMGTTVALPRVVARNHPLIFNIWTPDDRMDLDISGVKCATGAEITPAAVVIPSVGYNKGGYRLGYGGGYYDITLKHFSQPIMTIGVAYTELEVDDFPIQYHDQPLDYFVTGKEVIQCQWH